MCWFSVVTGLCRSLTTFNYFKSVFLSSSVFCRWEFLMWVSEEHLWRKQVSLHKRPHASPVSDDDSANTCESVRSSSDPPDLVSHMKHIWTDGSCRESVLILAARQNLWRWNIEQLIKSLIWLVCADRCFPRGGPERSSGFLQLHLINPLKTRLSFAQTKNSFCSKIKSLQPQEPRSDFSEDSQSVLCFIHDFNIIGVSLGLLWWVCASVRNWSS